MRALRADDNPLDAIQRVVQKHTERCIRLLTHTFTDDAVHEIRTRIKKLRALLALVRRQIGRRQYQKAKRSLRQVSHSLAALRETKVMLDKSRRLLRTVRRIDRERFEASLQRRLKQLHRAASSTKRCTWAHRLAVVQQTFTDCSRSSSGWESVWAGLRHVYTAGRAALQRVRSEPTATALHELRKQTKRLLYECELLRQVSPYAGSRLDDLKVLGEMLGTSHDMHALTTAAHPDSPLRRYLHCSALRKQTSICKSAVKIASLLYSAPPKRFMHRIARSEDT